ncbi:hypothetical protein ANCDUO_20905, partial [Ancylostoma duodenale]
MSLNDFEMWTNYVVNVSNIVIWPDYPRFPGPIFFNVTMDVAEDLPVDKIEMDLEVGYFVASAQSIEMSDMQSRTNKAPKAG